MIFDSLAQAQTEIGFGRLEVAGVFEIVETSVCAAKVSFAMSKFPNESAQRVSRDGQHTMFLFLEEHTFLNPVFRKDKHEPISVKREEPLKTLVRLVTRSCDGVTRSVVDCILLSLVRYRPFFQQPVHSQCKSARGE